MDKLQQIISEYEEEISNLQTALDDDKQAGIKAINRAIIQEKLQHYKRELEKLKLGQNLFQQIQQLNDKRTNLE